MCRICTLSSTKDLVAFLELGRLASRQRSGRFQHDSREFRASYPWKWWLVLVLSSDLEEIEEVRSRSVNGD